MSKWAIIWTVVGVLEPLLIGAVFSILGYARPEFKMAIRFIYAAAFLVGSVDILWSILANDSFEYKMIINVLILPAILIGCTAALNWIDNKKRSSSNAPILDDLSIASAESSNKRSTFPKVMAITLSMGVVVIALSSNFETKINEFGSASNSLDIPKGQKVILQWRAQGFRARAFLDGQPVALEGTKEFVADTDRKFTLRISGLTGDESQPYIIRPVPPPSPSNPSDLSKHPDIGSTSQPGQSEQLSKVRGFRRDDPDRSGSSDKKNNQPAQPPSVPSPTPSMPIVAILDSRVNSIYTASQVSSEATRLLAAYFRMNHYNLSPVPKSVQSPDQYMSMVRSSKPAQTGWIAQAVVEMHPNIQRKSSTNLSAPLNGPDTIVNLTMNCSVTINLMRLPNGYPTTIVGQGKAVRTIAGTAVTATARDPDFSRSATDQAMVDALAKLQQTSTITRLFPN
jgi:hypothetical protein